MIVNEKTWYDVRNTDGVTGFVGSGTKPIPLTEDEYENILREMGVEKTKVVHDIDVEVGETVKICSGPFENFAAKLYLLTTRRVRLKLLLICSAEKLMLNLTSIKLKRINFHLRRWIQDGKESR